MKEKIRDLSKICLESGEPYFLMNILNNHYCSIGQGCHNVECSYYNKVKDENNLHECNFYKEWGVDLN